jgi:hypothetical protein
MKKAHAARRVPAMDPAELHYPASWPQVCALCRGNGKTCP